MQQQTHSDQAGTSNRRIDHRIHHAGDVLPERLDSTQTKLVYLYLAISGASTVEELRDALGIELISLYPVLDSLDEKGVVRRDGGHYVCDTPD